MLALRFGGQNRGRIGALENEDIVKVEEEVYD